MDLLKTIYLENFPLSTTENDLKQAFSVFGKIDKIDLPIFGPDHPLTKASKRTRTKGFAFIEFSDRQSVQKACDHFNDINNILRVDPENQIESENTNNKTPSGQRGLALTRVMPKQKFLSLTNRYEELRFNSMVNAAKLLVVAT